MTRANVPRPSEYTIYVICLSKLSKATCSARDLRMNNSFDGGGCGDLQVLWKEGTCHYGGAYSGVAYRYVDRVSLASLTHFRHSC